MSSATEQLSTTTSALVARAKDQWAVVHAQWIALPETLRKTWDQLRERIQVALELPTKDDLSKLSTRLDDLDAKIAALIAAREASDKVVAAREASEKAPAVEAAPEDAPATSELHVKQTNAAKRSKKKG